MEAGALTRARHLLGLLCLLAIVFGAPTGHDDSAGPIIARGNAISSGRCPAKAPSPATVSLNAEIQHPKRTPIAPLSPQLEAEYEASAKMIVDAMISNQTPDRGQATFTLDDRGRDGWSSTAFDQTQIHAKLTRLTNLYPPENGRTSGYHAKVPFRWFGEDWRKENSDLNYQIIVNPAIDILVGVSGYGPDGWDGGQRPPVAPDLYPIGGNAELSHWSDVAYLMYAQLSKIPATDPKKHPGFFYSAPQWIYFPEARASDLTLQALQSSLNSRFESGLRPRPGETFPIGTEAYDLMLTSAMVNSATYFLTRHKFRFGPCVVSSITVWDSGARTADGAQIPDILLYIQSVDVNTNTTIQRNREDDAVFNSCGGHRERQYYTNYFPQWPAAGSTPAFPVHVD
ncbi:hypothetical protein CKM354_001223800 [Cercospora kikuchii]|uniref:Uncharacterized protein n=1 Tax=Cercospora kikuchii TaxID=84275 RepID=A0A9P3FLL5_9PEZI|nr:uncharacterized protein CKM354_001223800 [Cercospora kikuchii]GIZ49203.1 hypothetical protein CKM354_001223800 [Cercospora kikuchii]